jgi:hypothetical protein
LIRKGKRSAQLLTKARILLKADILDAGEGWSDSRIAGRWTPASPLSSGPGASRRLIAVSVRARPRTPRPSLQELGGDPVAEAVDEEDTGPPIGNRALQRATWRYGRGWTLDALFAELAPPLRLM